MYKEYSFLPFYFYLNSSLFVLHSSLNNGVYSVYVFSAATKLRTDWNIGNAAITNVINILETNGIIVVEVEASDAFSGLNGTLENGTPVIVVNKQMSTERKRFTALHELGHALLHFFRRHG